MAKLQFDLTFYGGKADNHRVSASKVAELINGLSDDILEVCRIIAHEDIEIDFNEIMRDCKLYIVGTPQPSTVTIRFETAESQTDWPAIAGHTLVESLQILQREQNGEHLPRGITKSVLDHVRSYCQAPNGEFEGITLTIPQNGQSEEQIDFNAELKAVVEQRLALLEKSSTQRIEGYTIDGILYGMEDEDYDNPKAKVDVKVDTGDGAHWVCHIKRAFLPYDLAEHWKQRVIVEGTAILKKRRRPEMEVADITFLGLAPQLEELLPRHEKIQHNVWEDVDLDEYMNHVRER